MLPIGGIQANSIGSGSTDTLELDWPAAIRNKPRGIVDNTSTRCAAYPEENVEIQLCVDLNDAGFIVGKLCPYNATAIAGR